MLPSERVENYQSTYEDEDYAEFVLEDENLMVIPCIAWVDVAKDADPAMYTTYTVTQGVIKYDPNNPTQADPVSEQTFDFILAQPVYEFGDDLVFDEDPIDDVVTKQSRVFNIGDYIQDATEVGFQKFKGAFKVVPAFETLLWRMQFTLEMPA